MILRPFIGEKKPLQTCLMLYKLQVVGKDIIFQRYILWGIFFSHFCFHSFYYIIYFPGLLEIFMYSDGCVQKCLFSSISDFGYDMVMMNQHLFHILTATILHASKTLLQISYTERAFHIGEQRCVRDNDRDGVRHGQEVQ